MKDGLPQNDMELADEMHRMVRNATIQLLDNIIKHEIHDIIVSALQHGGRGSGKYYTLNGFDRAKAITNAWTLDKSTTSKIKHQDNGVDITSGVALKRPYLSKKGINFATHSLDYDNDKLDVNPYTGAHTTPRYKGADDDVYFLGYEVHNVRNGGNVTNLFALLDEGGGGMFFGEDNPTRVPLGLSDSIKSHLDTHINGYVQQAFGVYL